MEQDNVSQNRTRAATEERPVDLTLDVRSALIWEADAWASHVTLINPAGATILGLEEQQVDVHSVMAKHVPPDDWALLLQAIRAAALSPGPHTCKHQMIRADGSFVEMLSSVCLSSLSNGAIVLQGITVDVSVSTADPNGPRLGDDTARLLIDNLRDYGVFMLSHEGIVTSWNQGARALKGYVAEEIIGAHISKFFPPDQVAANMPAQLLHRAELDRQTQYEGWLVRKDGSMFWASLTLSAVTDERGRLRGFSNVSKDLTERMQIEQKLQRSEEQFRLLVESVQDYGVFTLSLDGRIENWNRGAQRLKGYRAHEIIGSTLDRFFPADEVEKGTPQRLLREAELRGHSTYEGVLVRKDGSQFFTHCTISAVEDDEGRLRGFSNVARDMTIHKRSEDSLREREERLRLLIDSLQDYAIFMMSPDGRVETWSPGAERVKGYRPQDIIGESFERFFPPEELAKGTPRQLLERATADGRSEYEGWIVRGTGDRLWVNVILSAVKDADGTLRGFANVGRDQTERMRNERAQTFLADIGTVLAASLDFNATCDAICRLATSVLAHACIVVSRTNGMIEPVAVAHVDPSVEQRVRAAMKPVSYDPREVRGLNTVLHTGQSRQMTAAGDCEALVASLGITDPDLVGELCAPTSMCLPLSARGKTFGAVILVPHAAAPYSAYDLRIGEDMARRSALALDNARLFEQAKMAVQMREQVLAVVTHDLRSPLGTIDMAASTLLQLAEADPQRPKLAAMIKRSAERMTHMLQDLLDFASIERGQLSLAVASHDAIMLTQEAVSSAQPLAEQRKIRLEADVEPGAVLVRCDRERILQVFANLIGNALKFTEPNGVVRVTCRSEAGRVVFGVSDTGRGIAEEDVSRIFDRYWQVNHVGKESFGLGLAISKGIVESHGGVIWVDSKLGYGTSFFFALPTT